MFLVLTSLFLLLEICPNKTLTIGREKVDVTSPQYPFHYSSNLDCFWHITSEQSSGNLVITFMAVKLQDGGDFLTIGIGNEIIDSAVILKLSGNSAPRIATIEESAFWLRFRSNSMSQISCDGFWVQIEWQESYGKVYFKLITRKAFIKERII